MENVVGQPQPQRRRRRGPRLEGELLDAAWAELVAAGYAHMTMESVAARAHTGVAVLYRRWANKDQLIVAAIERQRAAHPVELPDTGTLRGDLLAALTGMSQHRATFFAIAAAAAFSGLLSHLGLTPAQARAQILDDQPGVPLTLYERAAARGEIHLDLIPEAVLAMPFELVHHGLLMGLRPLPLERIRTIVDDLFLPLVRAYSAEPGWPPPAGPTSDD